jgi:hypothetical protein
MTVDLDWENLGFNYRKLPFRYISYYKDGKWDEGQLTEDATLHISEASPALHYGQEAFEGLTVLKMALFNCSVQMKMLNVCNVLLIVF